MLHTINRTIPVSLQALQRKTVAQWPSILASAVESGFRTDIAPRLPKAPKLMGTSTKTEKGNRFGILTGIVYLSPSTESGANLCPGATPACASACLGTESGRMILPDMANSRLWKSALWLGAPSRFRDLLRLELQALESRARASRMRAAARIDGSSDTGIGMALAPEFPCIAFYDYTKVRGRYSRYLSKRPVNYHLTYSYTEGRTVERKGALVDENESAARRYLHKGGNVAMVFSTAPGIAGRKRAEPLPTSYWGFPVIDGDVSDFRCRDPRSHIVGLRFKSGRGNRRQKIAESAGFVIQV